MNVTINREMQQYKRRGKYAEDSCIHFFFFFFLTTCKPYSKALPFYKLRTPGRNV